MLWSLCQPLNTTLPPGACCHLQAAQAQHEHEVQQAVGAARQEGAQAQWREWSQGVQAQVQQLQAGHAQQLADHQAAAEQQLSAAMQVSAARIPAAGTATLATGIWLVAPRASITRRGPTGISCAMAWPADLALSTSFPLRVDFCGIAALSTLSCCPAGGTGPRAGPAGGGGAPGLSATGCWGSP